MFVNFRTNNLDRSFGVEHYGEMSGGPRARTLDPIARASGGFAMVAMDQRESLRTMFAEAGAGRPDDRAMVAFKTAVARALGPLASGFLIDRVFGFDQVRDRLLPDTCGLILAADALAQQPGQPVEETSLDEVVAAPDFDLTGVRAVKLLLIWRRDARREARVELARRFIAFAADRGVLSVLEPVVRPTPGEQSAGRWDEDRAIIEAAGELSALRPSLYKAQVPRRGRGTASELRRACQTLGSAIAGPWVVLSQGVDRDDFLPAVRAACLGGASGFLAGRALWSDVVGRPDVDRALAEVSVPRLARLIEVVDREATPWWKA
jgi:sulfofructosephosphate aldolase